jgi:hypothetical protein
MLSKTFCLFAIATRTALALPGPAEAQMLQGAETSLAGVYRSEPDPLPRPWPGQTIAITQTGQNLELKNDEGSFADGKLTSDMTLSANRSWDALGIIFPDHSIQWSNGTKWRKQSP